MITERGFGSEAAIRRGDRHRHRRWGSLAGLGWVDAGLGRMQRGEGGAGAETGEVETANLGMRRGLG